MIRGLLAVALVLIAASFFSPVWWVALKAPNYPAESFPDGVRIHFHFNGTFNGCSLHTKAEVYEKEALDCTHEMDAINHFVGMYPIASGGVVERAFSPFLISFLLVLVVGFMIFNRKIRLAVMALGFGAIAVWMAMTYYTAGGLAWQSPGYLSALVTSLGEGHEEAGEELSPIIAQLQRSLEESGQSSMSSEQVRDRVSRAGEQGLADALSRLRTGSGQRTAEAKSLKEILAEAEASGAKGSAASISILKEAYEADQARLPVAERSEWKASGAQTLAWHYSKALGRWFNNPDEIRPLVRNMTLFGTGLFWALIAGMLVMLFAARRADQPLYWLLPAIPALLPVFFLIEYSGWLWWYGHSLNDMGAFTLKPFMPTVFGQGKVAQFSTYSFPHYGFALMCAASVLIALAALLRRKSLRETRQAAA
ncbi:hypothetical protein CLD20_13675 [Afifella sp. IM 167]|nr:hypothetical protein [Afifella sp. IM 167]